MKRFLLSLVAIALAGVTYAYDFEAGGIYYNITSAVYQNCEVTYKSEDFNSYSGMITIPSTVEYESLKYTVSGIGNDAFRSSTDLLCTLLPSTVRSIGSNAYQGCTSMAAITFPSGITNIGDLAFEGCYNLTSVTNLATTPQQITTNTFTTFGTLHVMQGYGDAYAAAEIWNQFSIAEDANVSNPVTQITLDKSQYNCLVGETVQPQATVTPSDATISKLSWSSSDASIVQIDEATGAFTCLNEGTATITANATDGSGVSASATVIVETLKADNITLNMTSADITIGETVQLIATLSPEGLPNTTILWTTSDETVATVTEEGLVTGVMYGQATITAATTDGSKLLASCIVTVSPILVKSITLSQQSATLAINATLELTATVEPDNAAFKEVEWYSSDDNIATVTDEGLVTALAAGNATITAEALDGSGVKANCEVTVLPNNYDVIYNGIYFKIVSEQNKSCAVVFKDTEYNSYSGDVVIPDSIVYKSEKYCVKGIGKYAFYLCDGLTSVTIPATVTSIGHHAFTGCKTLASVVLPNSVTTVGESAFASCNAMTSLTISNKMTEIAEETFFACSSLTSVEIPSSVTIIGPRAFCRCYALESVSMPDSITSIGDGAFKNCTPLAAINIPGSTTYIGKSTFVGCDSLAVVRNMAGSPQSIFDTTFDHYGTLHVLQNRKDAFAAAPYWKNFTIVDDLVGVMADSISLNKTEFKVEIGETGQAIATIWPSNASVKVVSWSSSDEAVLSVNATTGKFKGLKNGVATLTATTVDGSNLSVSALVTVGLGYTTIETITLSATEAEIQLGSTLTLLATILPENANEQTLVWTSSDESIATVSAEGVVSAVALGQATITASTIDGSNLSASCTITVVPVIATGITISDETLSLMVGQSHTLVATLIPENTTTTKIIWSCSNALVATVSTEGVVTALSLGTAEIKASTSDGSELSATCVLSVVPTPVSAITLNAEEISIYPGESFILEATISPADATNQDYTWSSSDEDIVMVSNTGKILGVKMGTATVTATAADGSGVTGNCVVTVLPPLVSSINFLSENIQLTVGESIVLEPIVLPEDAGDKGLEWSTDNDDVAMVSSKGKVIAVEVGTAVITATAVDGSGVSASVTIEVVEPSGIREVSLGNMQVTNVNGHVIVRGLSDGTKVTLYSLTGVMLGRSTIIDGAATLDAAVLPGSTVIINADGKSVKVRL